MPTSNSNPHPLTEANISSWLASLAAAGKSRNTLDKYSHDVRKFVQYLEENGDSLEKHRLLEDYQSWLLAQGYRCRSVNSYISEAYQLCLFLGVQAERPRQIRPEQVLVDGDDGLTNAEYQRLLRTAFRYDMQQIGMMLQVLAGTSLRYSEMQYITVEVLQSDRTVVFERHGARKAVRLSDHLSAALRTYAEEEEIVSGSIFVNSRGNYPNRSNVWRSMKHLCAIAQIDPDKVSPQKMKHTFVKDYYAPSGRKV